MEFTKEQLKLIENFYITRVVKMKKTLKKGKN